MADAAGSRTFFSELKAGVVAPIEIVAILTAAYFISICFPPEIRSRMGVAPRSLAGLPGVFLHPLLHHDIRHLFCNASAIVILGWFISLRSRKVFFAVTVASWLLGGALLWVVGKSQTVVGGASGIVYGYLGFIMLRGIFDKRLVSIALSLLAVYYFHGALAGLLPTQTRVSWEGHLCGFAAGVWCAYLSKFALKSGTANANVNRTSRKRKKRRSP